MFICSAGNGIGEPEEVQYISLLQGNWNWMLKETDESRITAVEIIFLRKGAQIISLLLQKNYDILK